jgi:hypothetical protein
MAALPAPPGHRAGVGDRRALTVTSPSPPDALHPPVSPHPVLRRIDTDTAARVRAIALRRKPSRGCGILRHPAAGLRPYLPVPRRAHMTAGER